MKGSSHMNSEVLGKKINLGMSILLDPIKNFFYSPYERRIVRYARYYKHKSVKKHVILYEAFYGRGMLCGPYALFQELIKNPKYKKYHHVWVLDSMSNHPDLISKYKHTNVSFVEYGSKKYLKYLTSAGYLINNSTFADYFVKKPGQVYINTWHGIPLKSLGYDVPEGALRASNMARNCLHADYLISANPFLTDIYKRGFMKDGTAKVQIIEEGYPRLDTLVNTPKDQIYAELQKQGVSVDPNKKIILYAPTWRGKNYDNPNCSVEPYIQLKETLESMIDTDTYQILVKVHQVVYSKIKEELDDISYVVPATMDANVILGITDILISDFSSIYFDYLATGRPVLFYITDLKEYSQKRGLYFGVDELPGPYTDSVDELGNWINGIDTVFQENKECYDKVRNWCCNYDIGNISSKIVSAIFDGKTEDVRIIDMKNERKKVLISRGPMLVNGISTALINLLKQFDYEKYDVTVCVSSPTSDEQRKQIRILNDIENVRILVRPGKMAATITENIKSNFYTKCNPVKVLSKIMYSEKIYSREFRRLFGDTEFDYVIDYEGFNIFFGTVCLTHKNAKKFVWFHADMVSEYKARFHWLKRLFSLYPRFDYTVSCGKQIMETNKKNMSHILPDEKFRYAKNCVDFDKVKNGGKMGKIIYSGNYYYAFSSQNNSVLDMKMIPLQPEILEDWKEGNVEFRSSLEKVDNGIVRFATMGRLSVEKNQAALIRAFARLAEENPNVMLYLMGNGPERSNLEELIGLLEVKDKVILTGNMENPFGLLRQCDCFVLPSFHEGQPLVVFEARALHMPIILSKFSSVGGSMIENGQYLVDMDEDSIYEGLCAYMAGEVPSDYEFEDEEYNRQAFKEVEAAVFED